MSRHIANVRYLRFDTRLLIEKQNSKRILNTLQEAQTEEFEGDDAWLEAFRRGVAAEEAA